MKLVDSSIEVTTEFHGWAQSVAGFSDRHGRISHPCFLAKPVDPVNSTEFPVTS